MWRMRSAARRVTISAGCSARRYQQFSHVPVGQVENIDLLGVLRARDRDRGVALNAIRLPSGDHEKLLTLNWSPFVRASGLGSCFRIGGHLGRDFHQPKVVHGVIAADDFEVAEFFLAVLLGSWIPARKK